MEQVKWFERKFDFEFSQNIFPSILVRLAGTPARLEEKCKSISPKIATTRVNGAWSIQENLGHLIDLEPLWQGRLHDIINGETVLRPTDLQNNQTNLANHNQKPLHELLQSFRKIRKHTVGLLENINESLVFKSALHPRLKTPMRTIDFSYSLPNTTITTWPPFINWQNCCKMIYSEEEYTLLPLRQAIRLFIAPHIEYFGRTNLKIFRQ
jgi:hypothetical protein